MTLTEAQTAGYRPCDRVRDQSVKVVNLAGDVATVRLTNDEWYAQYMAVADARHWAVETFGDGYRLEGDALRPTLAGHVRATDRIWIDAHWRSRPGEDADRELRIVSMSIPAAYPEK